jgi:hypothetical protein
LRRPRGGLSQCAMTVGTSLFPIAAGAILEFAARRPV